MRGSWHLEKKKKEALSLRTLASVLSLCNHGSRKGPILPKVRFLISPVLYADLVIRY